jgi:hypothetical protein
MRTGQIAAPSIGFGARISIEADQLRRKLAAQLGGVSSSRLIEKALLALEREPQAEQPAG